MGSFWDGLWKENEGPHSRKRRLIISGEGKAQDRRPYYEY